MRARHKDAKHFRKMRMDAPAFGEFYDPGPVRPSHAKSVYSMNRGEFLDYLVQRGAQGRQNALHFPEDPKHLLAQGMHAQAAAEWPAYRGMLRNRTPFAAPPTRLTPDDIGYLEEHASLDRPERPTGNRGAFYDVAPAPAMKAARKQVPDRPKPRMATAKPVRKK